VPAVRRRERTIARRSQPPRRTSTREPGSCPHRLAQIAHKNEPVVTSNCASGRPLLIDSAPQTEFVLTHSKQTTEKFLTGARTHIRIFSFWTFTTQIPSQLIQRHDGRLRRERMQSRYSIGNNSFLSRLPAAAGRFTRASFRFNTPSVCDNRRNPHQIPKTVLPKNSTDVGSFLSRCFTCASLRFNTRSVSGGDPFLSRCFTRASLRFCTRSAPKVVGSAAFLPGSAQNVESDVTYSKQSTGKFLPGATTHFIPFNLKSSTTQNPARHLFFAVDSDDRASHDTLASRLRNRAARTNKKMPNESWPHNEVEALARELMSAYETGQMIAVPPSARPGFNLDTAYEVETLLKQSREAAGHKAVGRKVGYANKAMWRVLKLETLVWAHMYDDTVHYADANSATLSIANPRSLKIEPEIVFGLKQPVTGPASDAASALASVDWLALGFEIIDCPFPEWKFQPSDFVASFGLHAALVVGERIPVRPDTMVNLLEQLSAFKLRISKGGKFPESGDLVERGSADNSVTGGEFVEEGSGKNSLKSPALCLAELSAAIGRRFPSYPLSAGEIISTGTLTAGHLTVSGDIWTAEVEGLPLPPLTLRLITTGGIQP
jgi:2-keto-4-pentenoate hydratase